MSGGGLNLGKSVFIKTYGCQMNVYDSNRMVDLLEVAGYSKTEHLSSADLIILNTCHIREKAEEKVYSELGRLTKLKTKRKEQGSKILIAVAGCVAQAEGKRILERAPTVDLVFGPQTYHRLPFMVQNAMAGGKRIVDTEFPVEDKFDYLAEGSQQGGPSKFLTIQEGCDRFCTFCVVPYTRGAEQSRPAISIAQEARRLVADGAREITLLGQNVNAWHGESPSGGEWKLGRLICYLAEIEGIDRIRYTTSHPKDVDDELINAHREVPQLMPFLHLPVQSGSDKILAAMNRHHNARDYFHTVEKLRKARPEIVLSSDFIVGFPGEEDEDFAKTIKMVNEVGYAQAYSFKYSARPGTPAADIIDQVEDSVAAERLAGLQQLLRAQQDAFLSAQKGKKVKVLFERLGKQVGQICGRSPYMHPVHAHAPDSFLGKIAEVHIAEVKTNSLLGKVELGKRLARNAAVAEGVSL